MTTYLYLQCDSHNPPLQSPHEVGQHPHCDLQIVDEYGDSHPLESKAASDK